MSIRKIIKEKNFDLKNLENIVSFFDLKRKKLENILKRKKIKYWFNFLKDIKYTYKVNFKFYVRSVFSWFHFYFFFTRQYLYLNIKLLFFNLMIRHKYIWNTLNVYFYEVKEINFLTSSLISHYITRNLRIGHTLNRIIYPLMRHLASSQYKIYHGWKIGCFGRFKRKGRARKVWYGKINVPLNTIIANIDYHQRIIRLRNGVCNIKVFTAKTYRFDYTW